MMNIAFVIQILFVSLVSTRLTLKQVIDMEKRAKNECKTDQAYKRPDLTRAGKTVCKPIFDTWWTCWPEAEAGTTQRLPCSSTFFNTSTVLSRKCLPNGSWGSVDYKKCVRLGLEGLLKGRQALLEKYRIKIKETPCDVNRGGCEQLCLSWSSVNYTCACKPGYYLKKDGKSCEAKPEKIKSHTIPKCPNKTSGVCVTNGKNKPDGNYKWSGQPECFIQCVSGTPFCQCCNPTNYYYVQACDRCLHSSNAEACPTTPKMATTSLPKIRRRPTITNNIPQHTCTPPAAKMECNKKLTRSGQIPDPYTIHGFISCVLQSEKNLVGYCMKCPAKLRFVQMNNLAGYCGW